MSRLEEKQRAVQYYKENGVPKQLENLLNKMAPQQPEDVFGFMAEYFSKLSKPATISKIGSESVLSCSGYQTIRSTFSCVINGNEKEICSLHHFHDNRPPVQKIALAPVRSSAKQSKKDGGKGGKNSKKENHLQSSEESSKHEGPNQPKSNQFELDGALKMINEFTPHLMNRSCADLKEVDEVLQRVSQSILDGYKTASSTELYEEEEITISIESPMQQDTTTSPSQNKKNMAEVKDDVNTTSFFLSLLTAQALCQIKSVPFHQQFSLSKKKKSFPIPAIKFYSCSMVTPGKLNVVKELFVLFKPTATYDEGVGQVVCLFHAFENNLHSKYGASGTQKDSLGTLTPSFDKIEQVFEVLSQTCRNEFHVEFNEMFDCIINVGANEIYDQEKKKYDVCTGVLKSSEEMLSLYNSWIEQYSLIALVDPISSTDEDGLTSIYKELSPRCYIISSQSTDLEQCQLQINQSLIDGVLLQPSSCFSTVSQVFADVAKIEETGGVLMTTDCLGTFQNSILALEMGISLRSKFICISSPCGFGATSLQRLLDIHRKDENDWKLHENYVFRGTNEEPNSTEQEEGSENAER